MGKRKYGNNIFKKIKKSNDISKLCLESIANLDWKHQFEI